MDARQNWQSIKNIKELKEGYLSQVIHIITRLMIKYNAIVVMEDLNMEFKRSRQKVEKQVYQKFEKALIDKLNYYVDKTAQEDEMAGVYKALQLTNEFKSFREMGKQNGALFYVNPAYTSQIDPATGFVNLFFIKYESIAKSKAFLEKFKKIEIFNDPDYGKYVIFSFDYSDFTSKADGSRTKWDVCSYGERIYGRTESNGRYKEETVKLTAEFMSLFKEYDFDLSRSLKEQIMLQTSADFFKQFLHLLRLTLQFRNDSTENGFLLSPVKSTDGTFFDTREEREEIMPENAAANSAYNIARKGLWIVKTIKAQPDEELLKAKIGMKNQDWLHFVQK